MINKTTEGMTSFPSDPFLRSKESDKVLEYLGEFVSKKTLPTETTTPEKPFTMPHIPEGGRALDQELPDFSYLNPPTQAEKDAMLAEQKARMHRVSEGVVFTKNNPSILRGFLDKITSSIIPNEKPPTTTRIPLNEEIPEKKISGVQISTDNEQITVPLTRDIPNTSETTPSITLSENERLTLSQALSENNQTVEQAFLQADPSALDSVQTVPQETKEPLATNSSLVQALSENNQTVEQAFLQADPSALDSVQTVPQEFTDTVPGILPGGKIDESSKPPIKIEQGYKISPNKPKRGFFAQLKNKVTRLIGEKKARNYAETAPLPTPDTLTILEKIARAEKAMLGIDKETETRRRSLLEHVGDAGKKILNKIENIGDKFNNLPLKYRLGTGLAITSIAAIGATGLPFVIPTIALATMFRAASGAGTYALLHKLLEKNYKGIESRGGKVSFLRKGVMETGALAVATFGSYYLSEFIGSIWSDHVGGGHGNISPVQEPVSNTPTVIPVETTPPVTPTPEVITTFPAEQVAQTIAPPSIHTVLPNERLWDIVKNHLLESDAFTNLSVDAKNLEISKYIAYIDQQKILPNVHLIHAGDVIDFSKIDGKIPESILKHVKPFSH